MKIIAIRHGQPDYDLIEQRGFIGHGHDLAPLSSQGIQQAIDMTKSPLLEEVELIVSSCYTRALQTAAILSRIRQLPLNVEVDLHEWLPDQTFQYSKGEEALNAYQDFVACQGIRKNSDQKWESIDSLINRVRKVLDRYEALGYKKIAIVAHGAVLRSCCKILEIDYCTPLEFEYHSPYDFNSTIL